ncbi:hypothetical protein PQQ63_15365 [Paraburkholderia metrosideri]|uniref:Uncharacterized protein n=1 Tax=Paraburkholderia metrosideri TaxID=580937 RepID=A0ABW9DRV7_9BURK
MAVNWKLLAQAVLTGSAAAFYSPAAAKQGAIHTASAWNPTGAAVTLNVYLVPSAGTADDTTRVSQVSIPAGKSVPITDIINMKVANPAELFADALGVTLTLTGVEVDAS